jgi:hypothetical protein
MADADALAAELRAHGVAHVEGLAKRFRGLPAERKAALLAEAEATAGTTHAALRALRDQLRTHEHAAAVALLRALAAVMEEGGDADAASVACDGELRGAEHERAAVSWARERWPPPEHRVLVSCHVHAQRGREGGGVKLEFDALVLRDGGAVERDYALPTELVAVVEAKAGSSLCATRHQTEACRTAPPPLRAQGLSVFIRYADLPKLLRARDVLMREGTTLGVKEGRRSGERIDVRVVAPPELVYVFGSGAAGLAQLAARSALQAESLHSFS